jgi:hypothetical protein
MQLDVTARSLPPGFLVNKEGRACRVTARNNLVYCGGMGTVMSEGQQCGPYEGD